MTRSVLLLLLPVCFVQTVLAQHSPAHRQEAGHPFLTCFEPADHGGRYQNWAFAQDSRGVLYVGDNLGVLEYDGATWRLIRTATNNGVRALDVDDATC